MAEEARNWSRDAEELAACFTVHARGLFGFARALSGTDQAAGDLVQATFERASTVWGTLRDLPADQCDDWLRDTLAAAARHRTSDPAERVSVSPPRRRLTELTMARFAADYDAVAGLDRFADWLRSRPHGTHPNGAPAGGAPASSTHAGRPTRNGASANGSHGNGDPGSTDGNGAPTPPGSYGDPVSALYEQHYASLVRLAALLVRDTATAEEIVQDSFVAVAAAWRRRRDTARGDTDGALAFLRQSVLDRSRPALRHGIAPAPAATGRPSGSPPLLAALGALPARQREVLVLRYYANLSEEQAADAIGISRAAVRRHATRANAVLRPLLDAG